MWRILKIEKQKVPLYILCLVMKYSFVIPVYNRPDEVDELLESFTKLTGDIAYEIVIVEDGSTQTCQHILEKYQDYLHISYYFKANSGPGDSRNYGMRVAQGDYFIILDSDCLLPPNYLQAVEKFLCNNPVDCFGGPDAAHPSFSPIQKAINVVMTSILTTGGIRGGSEKVGKFQPRSFNMGLSQKAFLASGGFGNIHPGEDPDLSIRLWNMGFRTALISEAFVYHKRRIDWRKFFIQVKKFGKARPILNSRYPQYDKITYWFPTVFCIGYILSLLLCLVSIPFLLYIYLIYFACLFVEAWIKNKSSQIALYAIIAIHIQFFGYGWGYLYSTFLIKFLRKVPEKAMPEMFFFK